jgi:hypothetical protein
MGFYAVFQLKNFKGDREGRPYTYISDVQIFVGATFTVALITKTVALIQSRL